MSFKRLIVISTLTFLSLTLVLSVSAAVCEGQNDCKDKIKEYEEKLEDARTQSNSLSSQLEFMNTKIELAQINIVKTEEDIEVTGEEIEELSDKIGNLNTSLDHLSRVLLEKIVEGYKNREVNILEILLDPENATFANKLQYIQRVQENDQKLALRTQQMKNNFSEQKTLREVKKEELEELENQLLQQKAELDSQKAQKTELLQQTKNDEKRYQQLLAQALAEFQAINQAINTGQKVGDVKQGEPIALTGNTGYPNCSTGKHLHFEVRKGSQWVDPNPYLNGDWIQPLKDPIRITQHYGHTPYSWRYSYSGGIHTGIDMVSQSSDVIYAVADGTLYTSSQNCSGSIIKIKYIEHADDVSSFYLHVQ